MKHRRISSTRTRLAWLVAACLVPAFIMAGALVYAYYGNEQAKSVRDASATVNALTFDVDRELVSLETVLFALATSPHLTGARFLSKTGSLDHATTPSSRAIRCTASCKKWYS